MEAFDKTIRPLYFQGHYVADENGSNEPLRKYSQKTLVIVLPGDLTVFDIGELDPRY